MRVSVISTGSVSIRPQHVERTTSPMLWWLATTRRWTDPRPINVYVIEHDHGLVLFDTGQDRRSVTDPAYFPRGLAGLAYARLARFEIAATDTLTAQLNAIGYDIADVTTVVISHLHQDHMGGLSELTHADIVVSKAELAEVNRPLSVFGGFLKRHILLPGLRWKPVTPEPSTDAAIAPFTAAHDLFGDGSLLLLPTPGHTPGSLSLLVRSDPPMLLVGDLTYDVDVLARDGVPGVGNRDGLVASSRAVAGLRSRHPNLVVLAAHDPRASALLAAVTA
jgi:glyoxylase-like metal-dependent hydrolase (beta-lactamase superfamily II)